jgi:hypothetical protein
MAETTLRDLLIKIGFDVKDNGLIRADKEINSLISNVTKLSAIIVAFVGSMYALAHATSQEIDELNNWSATLGMSVQELQKLKDAADMADIDFYALTSSIKIFNKNIGEAMNGSKEMAKTLNGAGITSLKKANGEWKTQSELLEDVADKISKARNSQEKMSIAMGAFGRGGEQILRLLLQGKNGIKDLLGITEQFGYLFTKADVASSDFFDNSLKQIKIFSRGIRDYLGVKIIPIFNEYLSIITKFIKLNKEIIFSNIARFFYGIELALTPVILVAKAFYYVFNTIARSIGGWENFFLILSVSLGAIFSASMVRMVYSLSSAILTRLIPAILGLEAVAAPIMLLWAAIIALGVAAYAVYEDFKYFEEGSDSFIGRIKDEYPNAAKILIAFGESFKFTGSIIGAVINTLVDIFDVFIASIETIYTLLSKPMINWFLNKFGMSMPNLDDMIGKYSNFMHEVNKNNTAESMRFRHAIPAGFLQESPKNNVIINSSPTINLGVPQGTPQYQADYLKEQMRGVVDDVMQKHYQSIYVGTPQVSG